MSWRALGIAWALGTAAGQAAAQEFEGVIRVRNISVSVDALRERTGGDPAAIFDISLEEIRALPEAEVEEGVYYLQGSKMRMEASGEGNTAYSVLDIGAGVFRMVDPDHGLYVEWTAGDIGDMLDGLGAPPPDAEMMDTGDEEDPIIRPLGRTRVVNGIECTGFEERLPDALIWIWTTDEHGDALRTYRRLAAEAARLDPTGGENGTEALSLEHGFPMLTQQLELWDGEAVGFYEIEEFVSLERRPLSKEIFDPPAGARQITMEEWMQQMMREMQGEEPPGSGEP